jgi:hypothetical protein
LTSALIDGKRYLYAVNFTKGRVDVYDNAFHPVTLELKMAPVGLPVAGAAFCPGVAAGMVTINEFFTPAPL